MAKISQQQVEKKVANEFELMFERRAEKLEEASHETMSINPLLMPLLFAFHGAASFADLAQLLLAGHMMNGHATSFGKLIDEKILPNVFQTTKLTRNYRRTHPIYLNPEFNEIDHLVPTVSGKPQLLSLKTSRWTIQLTAAVQLNHSFAEILGKGSGAGYASKFSGIVVGVTVGQSSTMTDKYEILRGINRGAQHGVIDLRNEVSVLTGRDFWSWLNGNEPLTQDWVLNGTLAGVRAASARFKTSQLLAQYETAFNALYSKYVLPNGQVDWPALLIAVCG